MSLKNPEATGKFVVLSGPLLHILPKYHKKVWEHFPEDFTIFMMTGDEARINPGSALFTFNFQFGSMTTSTP